MMNKHWGCWAKMVLGKILLAAAALSLLLAWLAISRAIGNPKNGLVFGLEPLAWYWNALVLGILAIGVKTDKNCAAVCMPEEEKKMA